MEARSECGFVTHLAFHHGGAREYHAEMEAIVLADIREGWVAGPFCFCPPFEPMRVLPRNVVHQGRVKRVDGAV